MTAIRLAGPDPIGAFFSFGDCATRHGWRGHGNRMSSTTPTGRDNHAMSSGDCWTGALHIVCVASGFAAASRIAALGHGRWPSHGAGQGGGAVHATPPLAAAVARVVVDPH
jgi:hypothetical protein